jgi:hypothetical protein
MTKVSWGLLGCVVLGVAIFMTVNPAPPRVEKPKAAPAPIAPAKQAAPTAGLIECTHNYADDKLQRYNCFLNRDIGAAGVCRGIANLDEAIACFDQFLDPERAKGFVPREARLAPAPGMKFPNRYACKIAAWGRMPIMTECDYTTRRCLRGYRRQGRTSNDFLGEVIDAENRETVIAHVLIENGWVTGGRTVSTLVTNYDTGAMTVDGEPRPPHIEDRCR